MLSVADDEKRTCGGTSNVPLTVAMTGGTSSLETTHPRHPNPTDVPPWISEDFLGAVPPPNPIHFPAVAASLQIHLVSLTGGADPEKMRGGWGWFSADQKKDVAIFADLGEQKNRNRYLVRRILHALIIFDFLQKPT